MVKRKDVVWREKIHVGDVRKKTFCKLGSKEHQRVNKIAKKADKSEPLRRCFPSMDLRT